MKIRAAIAMVSFAGLLLDACRSERPPAVTEVVAKSGPPLRPVITPTQATLRIGDSLHFTVAAPTSPGVPVAAIWTTLDPQIADVDSLRGVLYARSLGTTLVKAALVSDRTQIGATLIQVNP